MDDRFHRVRTIAFLMICLALPSSGLSQKRVYGWIVDIRSPFLIAGGKHFNGEKDLRGSFVAYIPNIEPGLGIGLGIGRRVWRWSYGAAFSFSIHDGSVVPGNTRVIWNSIHGEFRRYFGRKRLKPFIHFAGGYSWIVVRDGARALFSQTQEMDDEKIIGLLAAAGGGASYEASDRLSFDFCIRPRVYIGGTVKAFESQEVQSPGGLWSFCLVVETRISYIFKTD